MSVMTATALIVARDMASAVFRSVAANARSASGTYASAVGSFSAAREKMHGALSLAMPASLGIAAWGHDQVEWDRAVHQYRAIADLAPDTFAKVQAAIMQTSNAYGVHKMELLEAAKGWQELGNAPESFIKNVDVAARSSRITGIAVSEQMKESSALMRAWGHSMDDTGMFKHFEEVYLVASKGMKGGAEAYGQAMQSWAPVAAGMGMSFEQASAFAQTLGGQFDPEKIGTALKTGFARLVVPTREVEAMLRSRGIDRSRLFNLDKGKLTSGSLAGALSGAGFEVDGALRRQINADLANVDLSKGSGALVDKLNKDLSHALGMKKGDANNKKVLNDAILEFISGAAGGLNTEEFFKQLGPLANDVAFNSIVFGKNHFSVFQDLEKQAQHFADNLDHILKTADGAVDRKTSIFGEGFAFQFSRMQTAIENFMNSIGGSGIEKDLAGVFDSIANSMDRMQTADPEALRAMFYGIASVAAIAPAGYILSGIANSLSLISGLIVNPLTITLAGGYLVYDVWKHWDALTKAPNKISFVVDLVLNDMLPAWLKKLVEMGAEHLNTGALRNAYENQYYGGVTSNWGQWARGSYQDTAGHPAYGAPARSTADMMQALQRVEVSGRAQIDGKLEATIKVDGPGRVTDQKSSLGSTTVPLNTGRSMPDTAFRPRGH